MPAKTALVQLSKPLAAVLVFCSLAFPLTSCSSQQLQPPIPGQQYAAPNPQFGVPNQQYADPNLVAGDMEVLRAQEARMGKVEVTIQAPVLKLLPDDTRGLPHQRFLLRLSNGTTVLIAHDTAYAPRVPLQAGDIVRIHGEYIWNERGGVIHWTHRSDTPRHEGGWIMHNGLIYQ